MGGSPTHVTGVVGRWGGSVVVQTIGIYVNVTVKKEDMCNVTANNELL
jgi:hypothetical protein